MVAVVVELVVTAVVLEVALSGSICNEFLTCNIYYLLSIAPIKVNVLPLVNNKPEITTMAREIFKKLQQRFLLLQL